MTLSISDLPAEILLTAPPRTDIFVDPGGAEPTLNATRLLGTPPDGPFQLSARVRVEFAGTYDAGALLVWVDERTWGKLCFERSPQGETMAVSVVTRGLSDDANSFTVPTGDPLWLRVSRLGPNWAFHASTDGAHWHFVRHFALGEGAAPVQVGFVAQSPVGEGCAVSFDQIAFVPERLADMRSGA
ncbi:DUF1349 domain-containing protein [Phytohabitans rumicis]|uniref:DUF1349 domain-containing protein n=1 Tax=Phytohabitans rumicis TaxID=1076125 RepID=A0A6V8L115_9ACTN|nr:DUF1349 domain-containing protein [Phytohabitans rumicis]GFJ88309.1 hypothetical protein Prum_019510 [Phytohabitans rumicis]